MRINGQDNVNTISKPQTQAVFDSPNAPSAAGRPAQSADTSTDHVDLGSQSGLLSQAQSASEDTRQARIDQLRSLVQSGQYEVDTHALSEAIVNSATNGY